MRPKSELHELVKSLTKTEKTYFKKFSARHYRRNSTFIKLFNELDRKEINGTYNEADIKQNLKKEKFTGQLPVTKNYLYNNILKSLNLYYAEDNIEIKLGHLINSAMILYNKELFQQSNKVISRAKSLAEKYDKPARLLEAIHIERQSLRIMSSLNEVSDALMKNYDEELAVLEKLRNISEYRKLYDRMVIYATAKGRSSHSSDSQQLDKILNDSLLKDYNLAKHFQSRVLFLLMNCFIKNLKGDYKISYNYGKETLELIGDSVNNKEIAAYEYILILQEMMLNAHLMKLSDESLKYYNILNAEQVMLLKHSPKKVSNFLKMRTLTMKLNINSDLGLFEESLPVLNELLQFSKQNETASYRDEILVTHFLAASLYFAVGRFSDSLQYLNRIFNSNAFELREDVQISCRILNLILHFELGNLNSLEYYIKSTYRYLRKRNKLSAIEMLVLEFLQNSLKISKEKELKELFLKTYQQLHKLSQQEASIMAIDLGTWIESKLENKSYAELLRRKK